MDQQLRDRELTGRSMYDNKGPWTEKARATIRQDIKELRADVRHMHSISQADKRAIRAQINHELENVHTWDFYNLQAFRRSLGVETGSPWDTQHYKSRTM